MKTFKIVSAIFFLVLIGDYFFPLFSLFKFNPDIAKSRETGAVHTLRAVHNVQVQFQTIKGRFGTLQELVDIGFLEPRFTTGEPIAGFVYSEANVTTKTYCIKANRWKDKAGPRDFNVIEDGEIRYVESKTLGSAVCGKGTALSAEGKDK
jgi:hypothetical protein